jgi:hypothetical protein
MVRCIQHVPLFNLCVLVYENGQILIITDKDNYDVWVESFYLHLPDGFKVMNVSLVNENNVIICCDHASIFSLKFIPFDFRPNFILTKIPDLDLLA